MTTRTSDSHFVSITQPVNAVLGDEWFNPTTNKLYKLVAVSGTTVNWVEIPSGSNNLMTISSNLAVTGSSTFTGTATGAAASFTNILENATLSGIALTGTVNFDVTSQSVLYSLANATGNWTLNIRGSASTTLNSLMNPGQSCSIAHMVTNGSTAYYNNVVTIDGVSVTPKYQGGSAISAGNASSIDIYTYTIIKTGNNTFTVFMSQTKFA